MPPDLKRLAGAVLNAAPFPVRHRVIETLLLAAVFREPCRQGDLDFLEGRCVKIGVLDFGLDLNVGFDGTRLRILPPGTPADVRISGRARPFLLMAPGREDPDTLFFQRRLNIEGDTELGLAVKNTMDAIGGQHSRMAERLETRIMKWTWALMTKWGRNDK